MFLEKGVLKKCSKFTRGHPCRSAISIKFLENFVEMALRHGCSPVNLLHIFRTLFPKNTFERLLLMSLNAYCHSVHADMNENDQDQPTINSRKPR